MNEYGMGELLINVRYANNAVPVMLARVIIRNSEGDVIGEYFTGEDGKIEAVILPAPEEYTANILADGFIEVEETNIPIETNNRTIHTVRIFPLYNYPVEALFYD